MGASGRAASCVIKTAPLTWGARFWNPPVSPHQGPAMQDTHPPSLWAQAAAPNTVQSGAALRVTLDTPSG